VEERNSKITLKSQDHFHEQVQ